MLNGQRYNNVTGWYANQRYKIPEYAWDAVRDNATDNQNGFLPVLTWYLRDHFRRQLPRVLSLQREYLADNPIHYWKSRKYKRADNRIASAFAQHTADFKDALLLGKPLKYGYSDPGNNSSVAGKTLLDVIKKFNNVNDMKHHDAQIGLDALITGRAYELSYIQANTNIPKVVRLNPNQCFVIYNTDVEPKELCAVRYYVVRFGNKSWYEIEVYNNNGNIYHFKTNNTGGGWKSSQATEKNVYDDVPITEFTVNDTKQGCFENALDYFDAYDKAISDMANSQEDFNNTTLVVSGKVKPPHKVTQARDGVGNLLYFKPNKAHTIYNVTKNRVDKNGHPNDPAMTRKAIDTKANVLFLEPYIKDGSVVSQPKAQYLTKSLDANEWTAYINELVTRIQQFTGVPNLNNDSTGNQTQLETASRLMDALNAAANAESNFRHGVIRRIKLLYGYLQKTPGNDLYGDVDSDPTDVTVHFNLNLPLNVQETIQKIQALNGTNKVSTETIQELAATLDGVPASQEANRLSSETAQQSSANTANLNAAFQNELSHASNTVANSDDAGDGSDSSEISGSSLSDSNNPSDEPSENSDQNNHSNPKLPSGSFNNPFFDSSGSATSEVMDPNMMFGPNGKPVPLSQVDNMALAATILDSLQASGMPSGFDTAMSNAVSVAASNSVKAAAAQSSALGGDIQ